MPNIILNLLPPPQKNYLEVLLIYRYLRIITFLLFSFAVISSALILGARLLLQNNLGDLLSTSAALNFRNTSLDKEITELNKNLKEINNIQANFTKWSTILAGLSAAVPPNIEIKYLNIEKKSNRFNLNGRARERGDYLKLKDNLEKLPYLVNLQSPLTNLLTRQNVEFQFSGQIKIDLIAP